MITTVPNGICGDLTLLYTAKYNDAVIDTNLGATDVMSFDPDSSDTERKFAIESDDTELIEESKGYSMKVEIADYPTATYPTASSTEYTATILFQDPELVGDVCENENVTTLTPTDQTASLSDDYSGAEFFFTYIPYDIEPIVC